VVQVRAAKKPFRVGDQLDIGILTRRETLLYCFDRRPNSETRLLYPALPEKENRFGRSNGEMKFPDDFGIKEWFRPFDELLVKDFSCIATEERLPDELGKKWFKHTANARLLDQAVVGPSAQPFGQADKPSIASDEADEILAWLRKSAGYAEDTDTIEVVPK
jgi:hypothetical protein